MNKNQSVSLSLQLRDYYLYYRIKARKIKNALIYDDPPPIFKPIWVNPNDIIYTISWNELENRNIVDSPEYFNKRKPEKAGTVLSGNWDQSLRKFNNCIVYKSFVSHFVEETPWEETELYASVNERLNKGWRLWGCETIDQFETRCKKMDNLFYRIKRNGYKLQNELESDAIRFEGVRDNRINQLENEIVIHIGRDGKIIFQDGRNRLSIAKILDLEAIPVIVLVRHQKWQELRDSIARGEKKPSDLSPEIETHPDLVDLYNS